MSSIREMLQKTMLGHETCPHYEKKCKCTPMSPDPGPIIQINVSDDILDMENKYEAFDECKGFLAWTPTRVYFPLCYDGDIWIGSAPRNPCDDLICPQGGG